jgi:hypothetical protein
MCPLPVGVTDGSRHHEHPIATTPKRDDQQIRAKQTPAPSRSPDIYSVVAYTTKRPRRAAAAARLVDADHDARGAKRLR